MDGRKLVVFALLWMGMLVLLAYPSYRFHKEQPEMMLDQVDGLFQVVDSRASHFKIVNGSGRSDQNFTVQDTQGKIWKWQVDPAKAPLVRKTSAPKSRPPAVTLPPKYVVKKLNHAWSHIARWAVTERKRAEGYMNRTKISRRYIPIAKNGSHVEFWGKKAINVSDAIESARKYANDERQNATKKALTAGAVWMQKHMKRSLQDRIRQLVSTPYKAPPTPPRPPTTSPTANPTPLPTQRPSFSPSRSPTVKSSTKPTAVPTGSKAKIKAAADAATTAALADLVVHYEKEDSGLRNKLQQEEAAKHKEQAELDKAEAAQHKEQLELEKAKVSEDAAKKELQLEEEKAMAHALSSEAHSTQLSSSTSDHAALKHEVPKATPAAAISKRLQDMNAQIMAMRASPRVHSITTLKQDDSAGRLRVKHSRTQPSDVTEEVEESADMALRDAGYGNV